MAPNNCHTAGAVGVLASLLVAAGLGASLYITTKNTSSVNVTTTTETTTGSVTTTSPSYQTSCGFCGPEISVTLRVENQLVLSYFNHSVELSRPQRELIFFLQDAADKQENFRFSAEYGKYGFFLTTINGLTANWTVDESWWQLTNASGHSLQEGVNSYIPKDGETIIFTYTRSGH